ncbi:MAG: PIN domain-containing protein [Luteitalea sp.]|nr:PIN domain-containing protein [Luteitalea sp.]
MTVPLLDTHAWVWWVDRDARIGRNAADFLDTLPVEERPYVAGISLWEVAMLVERGRLQFSVPLADWLEAAAHPRSVRVVSITPTIAAEVAALPKSFHRDPADRLIVATCRVMQVPLITHDQRIRRSRLVKRWRPAS